MFTATANDILALATAAQMSLRDAFTSYKPSLTGTTMRASATTVKRAAYPVQAIDATLERWNGSLESENQLQKIVYVENGKPYAKMISLSRQDLQLMPQLLQFNNTAIQLGVATRALEDQKIARALRDGSSSLCIDEKNFFAADHPVSPWDPSLGTYPNLRTSFPLNRTNFRTAYQAMRGLKGWNGLPYIVDGVILLVPRALEAIGQEILQPGLVANAGTASGTSVASVNVDAGKAQLVVSDVLLEDTVWYLLSYRGTYNAPVDSGAFGSSNSIIAGPMVIQEWRPLEMVPQTDLTSPSVFNYDEYQIKVSRGVEVGYMLPQHAVRCEG